MREFVALSIFLIVEIILFGRLCGIVCLFFCLGVSIALLFNFHYVGLGGSYPQQLISELGIIRSFGLSKILHGCD